MAKKIDHLIVRMPEDGNCLFHSIAYALHNTIDIQQTKRIRNEIVEYVVQYWKYFGDRTCNKDGNCYNSSEEYFAAMHETLTYGSLCELEAAVYLYSHRFEVYRDGNLVWTSVDMDDIFPMTRILFTGETLSGHFNVCMPI